MSFLSELVLPWREAFLLRRFFRNLGKKDRKNKTGASSMSEIPPPPGSEVPMLDFPHKTEELLKKPSVSDARACVTLVGMEVLQQREKYVIYKLRVEDRRPWSVDNVPVWHVHRRYSDFLSLFGKIRTAFPQFKVDLPPRKWVGSNFDPVFLGRRMFRLQEFIDQLFEDESVREFHEVQGFFSITAPPNRAVSMEFDRAVFDSFECVVQELRSQLRMRELWESECSEVRSALREREAELEAARAEAEQLRRQKDGLLRALQESAGGGGGGAGGGDLDSSGDGDGLQQHQAASASLSLPVPQRLIRASSSRLSLASRGSSYHIHHH